MSHVSINVIELPEYMVHLAQSSIDGFVRLNDERVVACGVDPSDASLVFVTSTSKVRQITPNGKLVPEHAEPTADGRHMAVTFQGVSGVFLISVVRAVERSQSMGTAGGLYVNGKLVCNVEVSYDI